jgi:2-haloacid dehalogenase
LEPGQADEAMGGSESGACHRRQVRAPRHAARCVHKPPPDRPLPPTRAYGYAHHVLPRWATFDCYGTLVDWNAGLATELDRLFGAAASDQLLARYHVLEPRVQGEHPTWSYRDVMAAVLAGLAAEAEVVLPAGEEDALGRSLPGWPVFAEVPAALAKARARGWRLVLLSNSDRDLIEASIRAIGVRFEHAIVASEVGSYKPAPGHWRAFREWAGADESRHVHVAQSHFHDIAPARSLGIRSIWINRLGERAEPAPTRELPDLAGLADVLDALIPADPS